MTNKRSRYYVDCPVQRSLVKRLLLHWVGFALLSAVCLFASEYFLGTPHLSIGAHVLILWNKYCFFIFLMLAVLPVFVYDTLKISNRFAGPIKRLQRGIHQLAQGETVDRLEFRDGDFWKKLSEDFNQVAARCHKG
ncbi:MAG: hypothetical protein KDB03_17715 [Planctomycetales bacterium]|nr:hypothetical protein [Planctomycetales bacterium]